MNIVFLWKHLPKRRGCGEFMIIIDDREPEKISTYIKEIVGEDKCKIERLPIGDIVCPEKGIAIERKSINDFYGSIVSQRIFDQCKQMQSSYPNMYLIISGSFKQLITDPNLFNVNVHVYLGAIASLSTKYGVSVINVDNDKQLAYLAVKIIEKHGEAVDLAPVKRLTVSTESLKMAAITACRGFSSEKATKVLSKYPTISMLCAATVEQLQEIDGIGPKLAENIKEVFD